MELIAGREMDVLIAVHLGWDWQDYRWYDGTTKYLLWHSDWGTPSGDDFDVLPKNRIVAWDMPAYSLDIAAAWGIIEHLRDQWTAATASSDGLGDFDRPFDDGAFFDRLHRHADRRWPWAFLYVTPEALCTAFLATVSAPENGTQRV